MSGNPVEIVCAHVWVRGMVQGVGFRAHVEYSARQIGGLTGWVRNVGYDTVEALAEGERSRVELLIDAMKEAGRRVAGMLIRNHERGSLSRPSPSMKAARARSRPSCTASAS